MRVLLIAESANPEWASVPLEGWAHSRAIASLVNAHLVTQIRNGAAIRRTGLSESEFTLIDSERVAKTANNLNAILRGGQGRGWTTGTAIWAITYPYFEWLVWKRFGEEIRAGKWDIVHRLTPLSPTAPSPLARWCASAGVPFVLGPLNGGVPWPPGFDSARRREREWLSYFRGAYKALPGYASTRRNAALLMGSRDTWKQMPRRYWNKCIYIPENAVDPARFQRRVSDPPGQPLRVIFVGRLVPYKGADMLLLAAAELVRAGRVRITFVGDGPEMPNLRTIVERERLSDGVQFTGWVDHEQIRDLLADSDVFAFPSIREFGGAVILESMIVGLVPIVVAYGGPGELVTPETGVLVPIGRREQIISGFREALQRLADTPESIRPMGERARQRVLSHFTWEAKAREVVKVYQELLGQRRRRVRLSVSEQVPAEQGPQRAAID